MIGLYEQYMLPDYELHTLLPESVHTLFCHGNTSDIGNNVVTLPYPT